MREELPIACTLDTGDLAAREQEWRTLVERSSTGRTAIPGGIRLTIRPDAGVEDALRRLIRQEAECCAWIEMDLRGSDPIQLDITAALEGVPVVRQMFSMPLLP